MPEIGEVARVVEYIRKHLVGKTLAVVKAQHDENVFGKVGTSAAEVEKALTGKKVVDAKQQGKYFWIVMASPPHPLFHFGMAGWWKIRNEETAYYKPTKPEKSVWPPKYWKIQLETAEDPKSEHAFVDFRRFGRVRLVDCAGDDMRKVSPLKENGPDPVIDKDILTEEWLVEKLQSKKIPVKALLLDQANISGIGNWVGDELLYHAKIHPEQYSNTLTPAQMKQLHTSMRYVCSTAVELLAESDKFPETWLFKHRWGKGKKDDPRKLPNGAKIEFLTVGGRTSAVVPSVQKKTGKVAADVARVAHEGDGDLQDQKTQKQNTKALNGAEALADTEEKESKPVKASQSRKRKTKDNGKETFEDRNGASIVDTGRENDLPSKRQKSQPKGTPIEGSNTNLSASSVTKGGRASKAGKANPDNKPKESTQHEAKPSIDNKRFNGSRRQSVRVSSRRT
ncbi:MAG: hypothetical protein Q9167_007709 [Letrouitia subvulpina]